MPERKYTDEQKNKIIEMYMQGIPTADISNKMGIPRPSISAIVRKEGVPLRRPKGNKRILKCHNCKQVISISGAKFCPFCGTDIRSEKDLTVEALQNLLYVILALPQGDRDTARDTITKAINLLTKEREVE